MSAMLRMFKSESVDGGGGETGDALSFGEARKPRLFRRSVTVPFEIMSGQGNLEDHPFLGGVVIAFQFQFHGGREVSYHETICLLMA